MWLPESILIYLLTHLQCKILLMIKCWRRISDIHFIVHTFVYMMVKSTTNPRKFRVKTPTRKSEQQIIQNKTHFTSNIILHSKTKSLNPSTHDFIFQMLMGRTLHSTKEEVPKISSRSGSRRNQPCLCFSLQSQYKEQRADVQWWMQSSHFDCLLSINLMERTKAGMESLSICQCFPDFWGTHKKA